MGKYLVAECLLNWLVTVFISCRYGRDEIMMKPTSKGLEGIKGALAEVGGDESPVAVVELRRRGSFPRSLASRL